MTDRWVGAQGVLKLRGRADRPLNVPPVTPPTLDPGLPFELAPLMAQIDAAFASGQIAAPHYFVDCPLGGDGSVSASNPGGGANSSTHYKDRMPGGSVTASDGDWDYRDEPYDPFPRPRTSSSSWPWQVEDKAWEIQQAYNAGLRLFVVDWLNLNDGTGDNRTGQLRQLQDAVQCAGLQGKFWVNPMIDGNTSISRSTNLAALIVKAASILSHPATLRDSLGRPYLFVYMPEGAGNSTKDSTATEVHDHFAALLNGLQANHGINARLWFAHQRGIASPSGDPTPGWAGVNAGQGYYNGLADLGDTGRWGSRNPLEALNPNNQNAGAIAWLRAHWPGKKWFAPWAPQDERPNQNKYEEARGFENFLAMIQVAIDNNAEALELITWSDIKEHAHIMPSRNHGWTWLDIASYYLCRWYLGFWPTVTRDTIYVAHRVMLTTAVPSKTSVPRQVRSGSTPAADIVSVLVFLRDIVDTTVTVTVGGVPTTFTPGPTSKAYGGDGLYIFNAPLRVGSVSASVVRGGVTVQHVDSPFTVTATPLVDDLHYRAVSSRKTMDGVPR